ncbi:MAG: metalloregulator ArsR/SmtB family transcription factor [Kiloniellales bacterium]|nr:metalloregulator ArsR/SmtB family transcription factor [Kiloniellales bacterium]
MTEDQLDAAFAALADPTRRAIVARLAAGPAPVGELAAPFEISLPAVSRHLKVLETAGLITREVDAQWRRCHLRPQGLTGAAEWIDSTRRFWEGRLDSLARYLEGPTQNGKETPHAGTPDPGNDDDSGPQG